MSVDTHVLTCCKQSMSRHRLMCTRTGASRAAAGVVGSGAKAADVWEAAGDDGAPLTAVCSRDALGERGVPNDPLGLVITAAPGLRPCANSIFRTSALRYMSEDEICAHGRRVQK